MADYCSVCKNISECKEVTKSIGGVGYCSHWEPKKKRNSINIVGVIILLSMLFLTVVVYLGVEISQVNQKLTEQRQQCDSGHSLQGHHSFTIYGILEKLHGKEKIWGTIEDEKLMDKLVSKYDLKLFSLRWDDLNGVGITNLISFIHRRGFINGCNFKTQIKDFTIDDLNKGMNTTTMEAMRVIFGRDFRYEWEKEKQNWSDE